MSPLREPSSSVSLGPQGEITGSSPSNTGPGTVAGAPGPAVSASAAAAVASEGSDGASAGARSRAASAESVDGGEDDGSCTESDGPPDDTFLFSCQVAVAQAEDGLTKVFSGRHHDCFSSPPFLKARAVPGDDDGDPRLRPAEFCVVERGKCGRQRAVLRAPFVMSVGGGSCHRFVHGFLPRDVRGGKHRCMVTSDASGNVVKLEDLVVFAGNLQPTVCVFEDWTTWREDQSGPTAIADCLREHRAPPDDLVPSLSVPSSAGSGRVLRPRTPKVARTEPVAAVAPASRPGKKPRRTKRETPAPQPSRKSTKQKGRRGFQGERRRRRRCVGGHGRRLRRIASLLPTWSRSRPPVRRRHRPPSSPAVAPARVSCPLWSGPVPRPRTWLAITVASSTSRLCVPETGLSSAVVVEARLRLLAGTSVKLSACLSSPLSLFLFGNVCCVRRGSSTRRRRTKRRQRAISTRRERACRPTPCRPPVSVTGGVFRGGLVHDSGQLN